MVPWMERSAIRGRRVNLSLFQKTAPDFISLHPGYLAKAVMEPHMNGSLDGAQRNPGAEHAFVTR